MNRLTELQIKSAKKKSKPYRLNDSNGLYLWVAVSGTKSWQYRYQVSENGKRKDVNYTIGTYPSISLAQARAEQQILKSEVSQGVNVHERKLQLRKPKPKTKKDTFKDIAESWIEIMKTKLSPNTWDKHISRLERFVYPRYADLTPDEIEGLDLLKHLKAIAVMKEKSETKKKLGGRETALRIHGLINQIIRFGRKYKKTTHMGFDLTDELPTPIKEHYEAILDEDLLGKFIYTIENHEYSQDYIGMAIRLMPHVMVRPGELISWEWKDINWKEKTWDYEVGKTKDSGVRYHRVYLSEQVIHILEKLQKLSGKGGMNSQYLFPGTKTKAVINIGTTLKRIRNMGFTPEQTSQHGFRATAMTMGKSKLKMSKAVINMCLAHVSKDPLGIAYDRDDMTEERALFMQTWSDYIIQCKRKYQKSAIKVIK